MEDRTCVYQILHVTGGMEWAGFGARGLPRKVGRHELRLLEGPMQSRKMESDSRSVQCPSLNPHFHLQRCCLRSYLAPNLFIIF